MSEKLEKRILDELLQQLESGALILPTLPEVALRVRDAVGSENVSASQLAKIISIDAALAARILQIANSAMAGGFRRVDTLEQAISRIGSRVLCNIVTSVIMQQMFQSRSDIINRKMRELWAHSATVAAICFSLASSAHLAPDEALLAGLVHDIGALPVLKKAEEYPELTNSNEVIDHLLERLHVQLGTVILETWRFSPELVTAVANHETPTHAGTNGKADYADLVIIANLQTHRAQPQDLSSGYGHGITAFQRLGIKPDEINLELDNRREKIEAVKKLLG